MKEIAFWDKEWETKSIKELEEEQSRRLRWIVKKAWEVPAYRAKFKEAGVKPGDIKGIEDLRKLPFTYKRDFIENYPYGLLAVPLSEVVRVHTSSGTRGKPVVSCYTARDFEYWMNLIARNLTCAGIGKGDVFQNTTQQAMFTGGLGYVEGAMKIGATVIPFGPASPERQLQAMKEFGTTSFHAIPSYVLRLIEAMHNLGYRPKIDLKLRVGVLGAEVWTEETRRRIEEGLQIDTYNNYGLAEAGGPGIAIECSEKNGLHYWADSFIIEIVDPKTGEPLSPGEEGEIVITNLWREALPLIRYRTGDIAKMLPYEKCGCGRTHPKISWIKGRLDDMIKVRGVGLYPSTVEKVIMQFPYTTGEFQIVLYGVDGITVRIEVDKDFLKKGDLDAAKREIASRLKEETLLTMNVELCEEGALASEAGGKAKKVVDLRTL